MHTQKSQKVPNSDKETLKKYLKLPKKKEKKDPEMSKSSKKC